MHGTFLNDFFLHFAGNYVTMKFKEKGRDLINSISNKVIRKTLTERNELDTKGNAIIAD